MSSKAKQDKLQKTPYGLRNQGGTCYLNSVLQLLFMTPEFHERLKTNIKTDQELKVLFEKMKEGLCETKDITKHLQIEDVYRQRDAAEYLELILNQTGRSASEVFYGKLFYSTKCCQDHTINEEANAFWTLPLPLRDQNSGIFSVERGLKRIFMKKRFSGVFCEDCDEKTEADSECEMRVTPPVLVLLLKRFALDPMTGSHVKSNCTVEIPSSLQIKEKTYNLYGIVDHWGSLRGGHYTATIQSTDGRWYEFNDSTVQKDEEKLMKADHIRSDSAYLLAFRDANIGHCAKELNTNGNEETKKRPNTCTTRQRTIALICCGLSFVVILVLGLSLGLT